MKSLDKKVSIFTLDAALEAYDEVIRKDLEGLHLLLRKFNRLMEGAKNILNLKPIKLDTASGENFYFSAKYVVDEESSNGVYIDFVIPLDKERIVNSTFRIESKMSPYPGDKVKFRDLNYDLPHANEMFIKDAVFFLNELSQKSLVVRDQFYDFVVNGVEDE